MEDEYRKHFDSTSYMDNPPSSLLCLQYKKKQRCCLGIAAIDELFTQLWNYFIDNPFGQSSDEIYRLHLREMFGSS